jgi:hypothetical protein
MRFLRRFNILLLLPVLISFPGCSSYEELIVDEKVILSGESSAYSFTKMESEQKPGLKSVKQKSILMTSIKYLARLNNSTPEAVIINMGVNETLKRNYIEAEILYKEILDIITDGSVENNLAVVYELTKRNKNAMEMYTNAVIKSPENSQFKSNLLSFINHNKFKAGIK